MRHRYVFCALAVALAGLVVAVGPAVAAPIAFDGFEAYAPNSQLDGQNQGDGFIGAYAVPPGNAASVTVVNESLSYASGGIAVDGGSRAVRVAGAADSNNLVARAIPAQTGSPLYVGFLYRTSSTTEAFLQFGLKNGGTDEPHASVGLQGISGSGGGAEGFFARVPNAGTTDHAGSGIAADTTYFLVARIAKGSGSSTYNVVDLFVNPTSLDESAPTLTASAGAGTGVGTFDHFILRTARTDAGSLYTFDELRIGTTFADAVPEPASAGTLAACAAAGLLRRRRRGA